MVTLNDQLAIGDPAPRTEVGPQGFQQGLQLKGIAFESADDGVPFASAFLTANPWMLFRGRLGVARRRDRRAVTRYGIATATLAKHGAFQGRAVEESCHDKSLAKLPAQRW